MAKIYINGTLAPIPRPIEVDFDPVRGIVVSREHHGAGLDSLAGLANYYRANGIAFKWRQGVVSTISATYSGGQGGIPDTPQVNYELLGNEIQKHIFESGIALSGLQDHPYLIQHVKSAWKHIQDGDVDEGAVNGLSETTRGTFAATGELPYFDTLMGFLQRGQTHFAQGQFVLKRSVSISNFYTGNVDGEGLVECLISTPSLLMSCVSMPPVMSQKISSIPFRSSHSGYAWGWRQLPSRMVTSAQNRVELSTEWWLEEWSTDLYGGLI